MRVKEIMTKEVVSIAPQASAMEAAEKMIKEKVGSLLVMEEGKLLGIISDRIIGLGVLVHAKDPRRARVCEFMREDVISVSPEMDLAKAAKILEELEIRYLPVVDDQGKVVGILSISDIACFVQRYIDCILVELGARVKKRKVKD